jgi:hypothetical protein
MKSLNTIPAVGMETSTASHKLWSVSRNARIQPRKKRPAVTAS